MSQSTTQGRKLGELLVEAGLVPQDTMKRVLQDQKTSAERGGEYRLLGQICVEMHLLSQARLQQFLREHQKSIRIGDLLVNLRRITPADLNKALKLQQSEPKQRLGEILVNQQMLSENELMEALSLQLGLPVIHPALELMDTSLLEGLDLKYLVTEGILPVSASETEVTVIFSHPEKTEVLQKLEQHFKKKLVLGLAPLSGLRATLKAFYEQRKAQPRAIRMDDIDPYEGESHYQPSPIAGLSLYGGEDEDEELSLNGSLGPASDESADESSDLLSALSGLGQNLPSEPVAAPAAAVAEAAPVPPVPTPAPTPTEPEKPARPVPPAPPPEPEVKEDTLIVGGVSLSSTNSEFRQQEGMLNYLINSALTDQASAIHIEPQGMFIRVRYRIDGVLHQKTSLPANLGNPMVARLKTICGLNPETQDLPQRNRVQATYNDQQMELGIATYPGVHGETMVLSLRQKQGAGRSLLMSLDHAGFSPLHLWRFKKALSKPGGLVIVTGPAHSGKTTTVYAALNALNLLSRSISTAESPVEQTLNGITQGNWLPETGLSFAEMIRSLSFLDPDVLMVSELDAPETLAACIDLALSGIKVISTYPSFDTMGALMRLANQGLEPFLISSSNVTLVSQRLVRRLCPACKQASAPSLDLLSQLGLSADLASSSQVFQPRGCSECNQLGYLGQTALHEVLLLNDAIREALLTQQPAAKIRNLARHEGKLLSMAEDGYYKAVEGLTSLSEIQRVAFINEYDSQDSHPSEELLNICRGENQSWL